ncbi:MAG: hypothetical protein WBP45_01200 [Daejeonella sp.]
MNLIIRQYILLSLVLLFSQCNSKSNSESNTKSIDSLSSSGSKITASDTTASDPNQLIYTKGFEDLKDFPKEWVMLTDCNPPDSITRNYVVMLDNSSMFYGEATIKFENHKFILTVKDYLVADIYEIKRCKKSTEAEMVYYNFDLISAVGKVTKKMQVNYRDNSENPQPSIWVFDEKKDPSGNIEYAFVSRKYAKSFKNIIQKEEE